LVIGKGRQIEKLIVDLKDSGFNLKIEHDLNDYLSCHIIEDVNLKQILSIQHKLIHELETKSGNEVEANREY